MSDWLHEALQSDTAFREQFNPNSSQHHGSTDTRPVPVNRASMPVGVDETDSSYQSPDYDSYPPLYHKKKEERAHLDDIKKSLDPVVKNVQALMKHRRILTNAPPEDPAKLERLKTVIEKDKVTLKESYDHVKNLVDKLPEWQRTLSPVLDQAMEDRVWSKEEVGEYILLVRQYSQQIFQEQSRLLAQMKEIAKDK
ncbi:hypothetical protein P9112_006777 [Eukaryota sp. TZLM1-RC]